VATKTTLESYLAVYPNYFWEYQEGGTVVSFTEGKTIAYTAHLHEILTDLKEFGIPPFGALLLTVHATNPNEQFSADQLKTLCGGREFPEILEIISQLPLAYKSGKNRLLVFRALFENAHNRLSAFTAKRILKNWEPLETDYIAQAYTTQFGESEMAALNRDLGCLKSLLKEFKNVDDILNKIAGLVDVEEELQIEEQYIPNEPVTDGDFVEDLINNSYTFEVGALVKRIWSGLNIPVHSSASSAQPLGGVSDIANKGEFDKLLISEFAYDDVSFLSRLANNEALYIQKEIPPSKSRHQRYILIDVSLKNWGTPKTLAISTMLAISKHPKTDFETSVYIIGEKAKAVDIATIDDIIKIVQLVEPGLHAANGLEECIKLLTKNSTSETILITEKSNLQNQQFAKQLNHSGDNINYLITTDREGSLDVYKRTKKSRKHIQHIIVPMEQLWREKKPKHKPPTTRPIEDFEGDVPMLWGQQMQYKQQFITTDGREFFISNSKRLYRCVMSNTSGRKGVQLIRENLPFVHGSYAISDNNILLMYNPHKREITLLNLRTNATKIIPFTNYSRDIQISIPPFAFYNGMFWHSGIRSINTISETGEVEHFEYTDQTEILNLTNLYSNLRNSSGLHKSFLKNINIVYIDSYGKLCFGNHILILQNEHLKLEHFNTIEPKITAQQTENGFVFIDGSRITVLPDSMVRLSSSDDSVPVIYFPTVLEASLGICTKTEFAGNQYYHKETMHSMQLTNFGPSALATLKVLKAHVQCGLKEAKEYIDSLPYTFVGEYLEADAEKLIRNFEEVGAKVEIMHTYETKQKIIATPLFYDRYVQPFIFVIEQYAAQA
jgi:ribosomal protein L7/L12